MKRDLACGVLMLAIAIAYYTVAAAIPKSTLADTVGPQGLPLGYAITLGVLSLLLIGTTLLGRGGGVQTILVATRHATKSDLYAAIRGAGLLLIGVAYVVLLPYLGYIVSIALLLAAIICYIEGRLNRWTIPVAVCGGGAFWIIFVEILQVPQPAGLWPSLI